MAKLDMLILRVLLYDITGVNKKSHNNFIRVVISMC